MSCGPVVVAFSGGADSAFLAWVANSTLGHQGALAVTAVSASLAPSELDDCRSLAREWDLNYQEVETHEDARPEYRANGADRCWHCKDELMRCLAPVAASFGNRAWAVREPLAFVRGRCRVTGLWARRSRGTRGPGGQRGRPWRLPAGTGRRS